MATLYQQPVWEATAISITIPPASALDLIEVIYQVQNPSTVRAFLAAHPFLLPVVVEAYFAIQGYFEDTPVTLALDTDPEDVTYQQLVLGIATSLTADEADPLLAAFDTGWWLHNLEQAQNRVCILLALR